MHDRAAFSDGMAALGVNARLEVSEAQRDLYWAMLADLSDDAFQRAVLLTLQQTRFFPTIAELRQAVTPHVDYKAEAVLAFDRVCKLGVHSAVGTHWSIRRVAEIEGAVAAEAFAAAGASSAFEREQGERDLPYLRKRFVDSYALAAEAQAKGRELAVAHQPKLPRGKRVQELIAATAAKLSPPAEQRGDAYEATPGED